MNTKATLLALLLAGASAVANAQTVVHDTIYIHEPQPKTTITARMIGVGGSNILDTYLSPERYTGTELRYLSHTTHHKTGSRFYTQIVNQGHLAYVHTRSGDGKEIAGTYSFGWGRHYNWNLMEGALHLKAGLMAELTLGFLYNMRNSNNPAQARAMLNVTPNASAQYRFGLGHHTYALRYELSLPLAGLMFSPNYGQSYYEIFSKGNYDHNIVATWPGNAPSMRHLLTLDFKVGRRTFRVGYLGDFQQARVNNLKQHAYSHALMMGVVF